MTHLTSGLREVVKGCMRKCRLTGTTIGLLLLSGAPLTSLAVDNRDTDGEHGVLHVHGALTESACRLDMASAWQDVDMGTTGTATLRQAGDRGRPVTLQLRLADCLVSDARNRDDRSGSELWGHEQPAVTVRFIAAGDMDNSQLIKLTGVSGLGLKMTDSYGRDIRLGSRGAPLMLMPGQATLNYTITPVRTAAPLRAGEYQAQVNFGLEYD